MTDCSRCGKCCEDISVQKSPAELEKWFEGIDFDGSQRYDVGMEYLYDAWFIGTHWVYEGPDKINGHKYQCSMFNKETRTCMAHEARPEVCKGYPWYPESRKYREELKPYESGKYLHPQCSFNADVRTMLPIVEIR